MHRVAIVTGASSGIGEATARELHRRGWRVGLVARRAERLDALAAELGEGAAAAPADVTDRAALEGAIRVLEERLGPTDLLLAAAGLGLVSRIDRWDPERATRVMRVNYDGVVHAISAVLPGMLERGSGRLSAVSSLAGWRGMPGSGPYSASKAALNVLLESLRVELAPRGVGVTVVLPGFVDTPMTRDNPFPMPFLWAADRAARAIADGLEAGRAEVCFPWQTTLAMRLARRLPPGLWDAVARRMLPGR